MDEYEGVRARLEAMRDDLEKRLRHITRDIRHVEGPPEKDFAEQAVEREHDEVLEALGRATQEELVKIKRALTRIDKGEYGICVRCGEAIAKARLEALPYSDTCIKCAETLTAR